METQNDYDRDVFNGDLGMMARIDEEEGAVIVTFDVRDNDGARLGPQAAIDAGEVAIVDAGAAHALTADLYQEGYRRVRHEPARQFQRALHEVVGQRREPPGEADPRLVTPLFVLRKFDE